MEQIVTSTDDELVRLEKNVKELLSSMSKKSTKKKFKILGKLVLSVTLIAGGVAVAILFPSPIVVAALGGAAALIGGSKGAAKDVRNVRKENRKRKDGKEELKAVEYELTKRKVIRDLMTPTAPPQQQLYPVVQ